MEYQQPMMTQMKVDILLFGNQLKRYITEVNQADTQMLGFLFELIGDIDGFIQHQHTFPTVDELKMDMAHLKSSTSISCTACSLTFGTTYQSYKNHMTVCKKANKTSQQSLLSAKTKKAPKIVVIPKHSDIDVRPTAPNVRRDSITSNGTMNSSKAPLRAMGKPSTTVAQKTNKQINKQDTKPNNKEENGATFYRSHKTSSQNISPASSVSSLASNRFLIKKALPKVGQSAKSNELLVLHSSDVPKTSVSTNTKPQGLSAEKPVSQPKRAQAKNPFSIPSPDSVIGFQEPLKINGAIVAQEPTPINESVPVKTEPNKECSETPSGSDDLFWASSDSSSSSASSSSSSSSSSSEDLSVASVDVNFAETSEIDTTTESSEERLQNLVDKLQ